MNCDTKCGKRERTYEEDDVAIEQEAAIWEINFVGVGAGHMVLSRFGGTEQWDLGEWKRDNQRRNCKIIWRVEISWREVYRHPSPVIKRPSRVRLRNIFIGRNYTYVHTRTHTYVLSLSLSFSRESDSATEHENGRGHVFSVEREYERHAFPAFFFFLRFRVSYLCTLSVEEIYLARKIGQVLKFTCSEKWYRSNSKHVDGDNQLAWIRNCLFFFFFCHIAFGEQILEIYNALLRMRLASMRGHPWFLFSNISSNYLITNLLFRMCPVQCKILNK